MKTDTYYFPHDYNARNDRKLIKIKLKYRQCGVGIYWSIIEMLFEENGVLPLIEIPTISADLREKENIVLSVIKDFGLFENDGEYFWSNSVKRRLAKRLEKSEKAKESIRIRWQNTNVLRTKNDSNTIKESKVKESKVKGLLGANAPQPKSFKDWSLEDFKADISANKEVIGGTPEEKKTLLNKFYLYWIEKSATGKMKFQLQKTWETKNRLVYWANNNFNNV